MATGLIDIMKRASMDAVENSKPCDLRYGTVISTVPIKVQITSQFVLPSTVLVVPKKFSKHDLTVKIDSSDATIEIDNSLKVGDKVALLRQSGGQSYFILDRI